MSFCTHCGKAIPDGAVFCPNCGANIAVSPASVPGPAESLPLARSIPKEKNHGSSGIGKIVLWGVTLFVGLAVLGIVGIVYLAHRVEKKVNDFTKPENATSAKEIPPDQAGRENGKPDQSKSDHDNQQVSKALDGIGGIMDRMGFGDRPPNPYADLPVVQSSDITKNLCPSAETAAE